MIEEKSNPRDFVGKHDNMSNWSELPLHLLIEIAEQVNKIEDFVAFGVVCKTWAAAGKKEYFKRLWLWPGIPYLLLTATDNDDREFYSLVDDEIVASVNIPKFKKKMCHESLGWLLAVEEDGSMYLLDPFSSVEIPVPHQNTFPRFEVHSDDALVFVKKFVLSARPNETFDFIVMIICHSNAFLAFWRPGDESWNKIKMQDVAYADVMYHGGHFYSIDRGGFVSVFTLHSDNTLEDRLITCLIDVANNLHTLDFVNELVNWKTLYILRTSLSSFMITRDAYSFDEETSVADYNTSKFHVYEVDMSAGTWMEIYDIRSMAIFVGHNATFAIDTSRYFGKIKGNHIYYSDDGWYVYYIDGGGKDMGVYNLNTGTVESFYGGEVLPTKICPSIWITPWS